MNLLSQGMTASTEISILRNNSSIEKSSQSIARFLKKADYLILLLGAEGSVQARTT